MENFLRNILSGDVLVLRNHEGLPRNTAGSDLDILVRPANAKLELSRISEAASLCQGARLGVAHSQAFFKAAVICRDRGSGEFHGVCVDLFSGLTYRGADLIDVTEAFRIAEEHDGFRALPPWAAATIAVLKELLNNSSIPEKHLVAAQEAFLNENRGIELLLQPIGSSAINKLRRICNLKPNEDQLLREAAQLRTSVRKNAARTSGLRFFGRWTLFHVSRLRRMASPPGLVVAMLGTDGAGKSTIIDAITPILQASSHKALAKRHLRPSLLPALGTIIRKRSPSVERPPTTDPHGSAPAGYIGSIVRIVWLFTDYIIGYWVIVRPQIARAPSVFLFDRYADDLAIDPKRFRIGRFKTLARFIPRVVPRPDLVVVLHAEPDAVHNRKPELSIGEIRRQNYVLRDWVEQRPEAILVDTSGSIEETRDKVLDAIANKARERANG